MQRLRSLRRSMSRSSRKSGGSPNSASSSPRASQDSPSRGTPDTASSTPDLRASAHSGDQPADPPSPSPAPRQGRDQPDTSQQLGSGASPNQAETADSSLSQPQDSLASLSTSITEPPIIVEPPSPSPVTAEGDASATATGREFLVDSTTHRRKATDSDQGPAPSGVDAKEESKSKPTDMPVQRPWLVFAVASGGFAALNGAFAKLTTASLTTNIATFLSTRLQIPIEFTNPVIRGVFFLMNIVSNAIMWALFTRALTAHSSATKVSLINTSANFLVTAVLGAMIFSEVLPPSWFGGAALLVLGTLIIGRDRRGEGEPEVATDEEGGAAEGVAGEIVSPRQPTGLGIEKTPKRSTELEPLLAGDEAEGVLPDGEEE